MPGTTVGGTGSERSTTAAKQMEYTMKKFLQATIMAAVVGLAGATTANASSWQESILRMPVYSAQQAAPSYAQPSQKVQRSKKRKSAKTAWSKPSYVGSSWSAQPKKAKRKGTRVASLGNSYSYSSGGGGGASSGLASYYWQPQRVASGGWFNPNAMTAAHKTLPFGTRVRVTNVRKGRSVVVTINDRGPYIAGRVIDLSKAAAGVIGMQQAGVVPVRIDRM